MERQIVNLERAEYILYNASKVYDTNPLVKTRKRYTVWCRVAIAKILHNEDNTLVSIARFIKKDHATIIHYMKIHDALMKYDKEYRQLFEKFKLVLGDRKNNKDYLLNAITERIHYSIETMQALNYDMDFIENYFKQCIEASKSKLMAS
jgi:hypothetical protein